MLAAILRSAFFYRRINTVVALAVAISTAVIGGSLIVGDSVRYSLRQMTRERLGKITHVVHGRFVREQLAADVADHVSATVAPAILVTAGVERTRDDEIRRVGSVGLLAIEEPGWQFFETGETTRPGDGEIVLGYRTAQELDAGIGDTVSAWVELPSAIPRDSLLGEREETSAEIRLTVTGILAETDGASRFTLNPGQQLPFNAFVSLAGLQVQLGLSAVERSRRNPIAKPAMVNTLLIHNSSDEDLAVGVRDGLTLEDLSLRLRIDEERGYLSAETDRMILENSIVDGIEAAAESLGIAAAPTLVYLINEFAAAERKESDERYSMYSIAAGMPLDGREPLGPMTLADRSVVTSLADDEILLSDWLREDLEVQVGDRITARWHEVGSHGELPEVRRTFRVRGVFADDDRLTVDAGLTPQIPGVTDVESFADWDQPFEMDMGRITGRDDLYWAERRATPKAFVAPEVAQKYWSSRFGRATSVRLAAGDRALPTDQLEKVAEHLADRIPRRCELDAMGLTPIPVLADGLEASSGANDFTQLFAGFSVFLILSAIILASLMFRLGIQQRISQAGLLQAVGLPDSRVRWFFLGEGLLVACAGATLGIALAIGFAKLMIYGLTTWWIGAIGTRFLLLHVVPWRLAVAAVISVALAAFVIWRAVRHLQKSSVRELLSGRTDAATERLRSARWINVVTAGSLLAAILCPAAALAGWLPGGEAFSGLTWNMVAFFLGGSGCLAGGLLLLRSRLQSTDDVADSRSMNGVSSLAMANAARSPWRSLLTTALIASATFLIVAVGAGRRNPLSETPDRESGNGGFRLIAESSQSVVYDLNSEDGRTALAVQDDFQKAGLDASATVYSFSSRPGEDASCVNLYQTHLPTLLGATPEFLRRGGFRFANTPGDNPWELLSTPIDHAGGLPRYPVIGDMNTLMYSLKKGIGDVIPFPDDDNAQAELQIVGMLDGSLFQGVLVMNRDDLLRLDPDVSGFRYFLAEADSENDANALATLLESRLNAFGMDTEPVGQRLAGFLAVQNTYLSTFQMLGGLGLLLGTFGLAAVMIRNVVEREPEIALLRAVGFTGFRISRLVLTENCVLLFWGILLGTVSALLAMLPHLLSTGADLPWQSLGITLAGVCVAGIFASLIAIRRAQSVTVRDNLSVET